MSLEVNQDGTHKVQREVGAWHTETIQILPPTVTMEPLMVFSVTIPSLSPVNTGAYNRQTADTFFVGRLDYFYRSHQLDYKPTDDLFIILKPVFRQPSLLLKLYYLS